MSKTWAIMARAFADALPKEPSLHLERAAQPAELRGRLDTLGAQPGDMVVLVDEVLAVEWLGVVKQAGGLALARPFQHIKLQSGSYSAAWEIPANHSDLGKLAALFDAVSGQLSEVEEVAPAPRLASPATIAPAPSSPRAPVAQPPQNLILYGPPGTGKTYAVVKRTLALLGEDTSGDDGALRARFEALRSTGRVAMLTFHQAYEYEEFIEGIRPLLEGDEVGYELRSGVFKRLCIEAALSAKAIMAGEQTPQRTLFERMWVALIEEIERGVQLGGGRAGLRRGSSQETKLDGRVEVNHRKAQISWKPSEQMQRKNAPRHLLEALWLADSEGHLADEDYSYGSMQQALMSTGLRSAHNMEIMWRVYRRMRELERLGGQKGTPAAPSAPKEEDYESLEDVFGQDALLDMERRRLIPFDRAPACVLIIDEINRGNIAKIFGELITLIEPSKRLGMPEGMLVTLPYSQKRFGVPANLHIIGTMNTADRSIALMDIALRRRFVFEELMPDAALVEATLAAPDRLGAAGARVVADALRCLNARIEFLLDRDHTIGHAYFMGARSWQDVYRVMTERVLPLLQEYFYGAWDRICAALGCPYSGDELQRANPRPWLVAQVMDERVVLGYDHDDYESSRATYTINPAITHASSDAMIEEAMRGVIAAELLALLGKRS